MSSDTPRNNSGNAPLAAPPASPLPSLTSGGASQAAAAPQPPRVDALPTLVDSVASAAAATPPEKTPSPQKTPGAVAAAADAGRAAVQADLEARIAQTVLEQIGPDLDQRIGQAIARVVHEQMLGLGGRVRNEVTAVVREAVTHALLSSGGVEN
ncbi:MAG: hypothetical protein LBP52_09035 [Burkholderiaceae bacterium]|jgi:hypothetical protein|nr:hypothetical protein [Burkholderiaceae bacterium]